MGESWASAVKLAFCLVGMAVSFSDQAKNFAKDGHRGTLDIDQVSEIVQRDFLYSQDSSNENGFDSGQEGNLDTQDEFDSKENLGRRTKTFKSFNSGRRCFLSFPYACSPELADPSIEWPSPWGWTPGPLYPEYGPDFHRGWMGHTGPFGYNHCGCGVPWRGPGCGCGCNNQRWCCCGGGGGGGQAARDWPQYNDALSITPPLQQQPKLFGHPPLLQPFLGKQAHGKDPQAIKPGKVKNNRRGYKRFDVTYGGSDPYGTMPLPPAYEYPCDPSYVNWPCQPPAQQSSIADQVAGALFLWKPNANPLSNKHSNVKS